MAQNYFPMASYNGDRTYNNTDFTKYYEMLFRDGVAIASGDGLRVKESPAGGMRVVVSSGQAIMKGYQYINTKELAIQIPVASVTRDRRDSLVIRHDVGARQIYVAIKEDDLTVERTELIYELQLAEIFVPKNAVNIPSEYIKDKRSDETVCGYCSPFDKVPVSGLEDEYRAMLQNIYDSFNTKSTARLDNAISQFQAWFENLKNQLSSNQATNLQNQLDNLRAENELITIDHNLGIWPQVSCLYWEYGLGTVPLEEQPAGVSWDGTAPETVNIVSVVAKYPSRNQVVIKVPGNQMLHNPTITQVDNKWLLQEGHKSVQVMLGQDIRQGV